MDDNYAGSIAEELASFKNDITTINDMINHLMQSQNLRMDKLEDHILEIKTQ